MNVCYHFKTMRITEIYELNIVSTINVVMIINWEKSIFTINFFYSFLNNEYVLKFKYFLFEINKVVKNTNRNKLEMIKITDTGKYQSIPKKFVTK